MSKQYQAVRRVTLFFSSLIGLPSEDGIASKTVSLPNEYLKYLSFGRADRPIDNLFPGIKVIGDEDGNIKINIIKKELPFYARSLKDQSMILNALELFDSIQKENAIPVGEKDQMLQPISDALKNFFWYGDRPFWKSESFYFSSLTLLVCIASFLWSIKSILVLTTFFSVLNLVIGIILLSLLGAVCIANKTIDFFAVLSVIERRKDLANVIELKRTEVASKFFTNVTENVSSTFGAFVSKVSDVFLGVASQPQSGTEDSAVVPPSLGPAPLR